MPGLAVGAACGLLQQRRANLSPKNNTQHGEDPSKPRGQEEVIPFEGPSQTEQSCCLCTIMTLLFEQD